MSQNTGESPKGMPVTPDDEHEVGHARDGRRWDGIKWVPAGSEGIASVENPPHHDEAEQP